jgi:hypothetical protein
MHRKVMNPELPSFGAKDGNAFFPALSNGAVVEIKILSEPEIYESLYGEKIRIGVKVVGLNEKSGDLELMKEYTVSSSAMCWRELHKAWDKVGFFKFTWLLTCEQIETKDGWKSLYQLKALAPKK